MKTPTLYPVLALLLWITLLVPQFVKAQELPPTDTSDYYILRDTYPAQSLFQKTSILIEKESTWTIEDMLAGRAADHFRPLTPEYEFHDDSESSWLRVMIRPEVSIRDWWLFIKNNNLQYEYLAFQDRVDVYFVRNGELIRHAKTGIYVPASEKDIAAPVTMNRIRLDLQAGEPVTLYIHIQDDMRLHHELEIRDPSLFAFALKDGTSQSLQIMKVITMVIGIYVFCFFFYTYDWSFLYFFGMMTCFWVHYQVLDPNMPLITWLIPEHPDWIGVAWILTTMGAFIFFLQFGRTFTNLKQISPLWDRIIIWTIYTLFLIIVIRIGIWTMNDSWMDKAENVGTLFFFIGALIICLRLGFFKDKLVRYFVFGALWLYFFSICGLLWNLGYLTFFDLIPPWIIAQGGFMIIYALALAYKIQISERARSEIEKVKEVDSIKSRFFANISHEFRTPLSLILGPVNQTLESVPASEEPEGDTEISIRARHLNVIKRNALRLQHLINQILDLSKLDRGKMQLQVAPGNILQFIRAMVFSFESLAERKHIHFHTHFPPSLENAWFDRDKLEKILVNLLSNAFKFTPEHGEVTVQLSTKGNRLKIEVSNTGSSITPEAAQKVFERFYQVEGTEDQGTGIGLSLVKELVELHRGQISVESIEGQLTSFKTVLPFLREDFRQDEIIPEPDHSELPVKTSILPDLVPELPEAINGQSATDLPLILIVEDNADLRYFISEQLSGHYQIMVAPNGRKGLQIAEEKLPDLIVSDVMMPEMNGIELCNAVKQNIKTSHIPLILLTAKAGQDARIEGLQTGADAYLTKPFDGRELRVRIGKLIEQRQLLREKFTGEFRLGPAAVNLNSMDEQFLQQVKTSIEQNLDNEYFSVEDLATSVGFSRSQLNRKLKGLTSKSPNQLIREFRMQRARELLEQKAASVSEIAYQVGYSNLSYFSKSYKEAFGVSPSEV